MTLKLPDTPLAEEEKNKATALFKKYNNAMLNFAVYKVGVGLAEEVVQDTFINIFKKLDEIGEIDCSKTRNYLFKAVKYAALHRLRKEKILCEDIDELANRLPEDSLIDNTPADSLSAAETRECLRTLIERLPQKKRDVLIAFYYWNWECKTIADFYGMTVSNVTAILTRARAKLKKQLEEQEKGETAQ